MSDPSLPGTPGTGPIPEPEPEGFREEQVDAEKQRLVDEQTEALQRSKDAKDFYTGKPEEPPPPEADASRSGQHSDSHTTHKSTGSKGTSKS